MRISLHCWALLCLTLLASSNAAGQPLSWERVATGPYGGQIGTLIEHPDGTLFAATSPGWSNESKQIYRSDDNGASWELIDTGSPPLAVYGLDIAPDGSLYAPASMTVLMRSADKGESWDRIHVEEWLGTHVATDSAGTIYLSNWREVLRSTDDGETWTKHRPEIPDSLFARVDGFVAMNRGVLLLDMSPVGLFRSMNRGETWEPVPEAEGSIRLLMKAHDGTVFFQDESGASNPYHGLKRSDDGVTWSVVPIPFGRSSDGTPLIMTVGTTSTGNLLVSDWGHLYRSQDDGTTWTKLTELSHLPGRGKIIETASGALMLGTLGGASCGRTTGKRGTGAPAA